MKRFYTNIFAFLLFILFPSCNDENLNEDIKDLENKSSEIEFDLIFPTRTGEDEESTGDLEKPSDYFTPGESVLLVSQRSEKMSLSFEEGNPNCYKYVYYANNDANWDLGYNFNSDKPLKWETIESNGQYGASGYAFGALFFPKDYKYTDRINSDQSQDNDFAESDVMGAYHVGSYLSRLRFRLFHLMSKLRITLYVPVWDNEKGSGFNANAVKDAETISFRTDYAIEWSGESSEKAPTALPPENNDGIKSNIKIFLSSKKDEEEELTLSQYSSDYTDDEKDMVREYTYEVYFPQQNVNGNFLRFILTRGNTDYNYVFNSAYLKSGSTNFAFKAGEITQLKLYIPRSYSDIVLLDAEIVKWNESSADITIRKDENE